VSRPWRITFKIAGEIEVYPPDTAPTTGHITFRTQKGQHMGEITVVADETTLTATVTFTDAEGNATTPDQTPTWEVADAAVLTVTPAADGMSATFEVGAPGVSSVSVTTTETHGGEGEPTEVLLTGLVTVVAGDTVTGSIEFATTPTP